MGRARPRPPPQLQLIQPAEVRSLLFATAVILCEGQTETGALPRWWQSPQASTLPGPAPASVSFISADGHNGYGRYIRLLDAFAIPWAIIADGPALRKGSKLSDEIRDQGTGHQRPNQTTSRTSTSGGTSGSTQASSRSPASSATTAPKAANSKPS